jgi:hypothetical protein
LLQRDLATLEQLVCRRQSRDAAADNYDVLHTNLRVG